MFEYVPGTWGIGSVKLPDFGLTELINAANGRNTSNPTWNNPAVYKAVGGVPQAQNTNLWGGGPQPTYTNPINMTNKTPSPLAPKASGGSTAPTINGVEPVSTNGGIDFAALLDQQRQYADNVYNQVKSQFDTGMNILGQKRQQFTDIFNKGKDDILQGFQKGAGELQSAAQGENTRNANALRALGLGGSAVERTKGRQTQNNMKALAGLQDIRGQNEFQNQEAYNTNNQWADTQEGGLRSFLQSGDLNRQAAGMNVMDNLAGIFNNIINSQMAYNAAMGQKTASPYAVNIPTQLNAITSALGDYGVMGGQDPNAGVSINPKMTQDQLLAEDVRKRLYGFT